MGLFAIGCSKASAKELIEKPSTFAEKSTAGSLHWNIASDGKTALVAEGPDGSIEKSHVTGQLTFATEQGKKTVPLTLDQKSGVLRAEGPKLDHQVTEVHYALLLDGKPATGTLFVPETGTRGLVEASKKSAAEAKPQHGGQIEVVDGHSYEVASDSKTGQTRVYALDPGKKPKALELALDADPPRRVKLDYDDAGYYVAVVHHRPRAMSLVVIDEDDDAHVAVVGYRPGVVFVVDHRPAFWIERDWGHPGLARGHYKGTPWGPPGQYHGGHKLKFKGGGHGHGHGRRGH